MLCFYRISDSAQTSATKPKIPQATKIACLQNFVSEFDSKSIYVIADNVTDTTLSEIVKYVPSNQVIRTSYGSGGIAFLHAAIIVKESGLADNAPVYFVEDDYIHYPGAKKKILEGLNIINVHYVTGYDHPDKYQSPHQEVTYSKVYSTESSHWRTTPSTTMTFATTVRTVKDDYPIYEEFCKTGYPYDDDMFRTLNVRKNRHLVSSIPGVCTHSEIAWLSPHIDWHEIIEKYTES